MRRAQPSRLLTPEPRAPHGWFETILARAESEAAEGRTAAADSDEWAHSGTRDERRHRARLIGSFVAGLAVPMVLLSGVSLVAWQRSSAETVQPPQTPRAASGTPGERSSWPKSVEPVEATMREPARLVLGASQVSMTVMVAEKTPTPAEQEPPSLPPRPSRVPPGSDLAQPTLTPMKKTFIPDAPRASQEITLAAPRWRGRDREPIESSDIVDWFIREYPRRLEAGGL
jgi:hypothetical protein